MVKNINLLKKLIPSNKEVLFLCIGTDRSTGDSLGPLVGTHLKSLGHTVLGTLKEPVHAVNLEENLLRIKEEYPEHFIIAIDACLGRLKNLGMVRVNNAPLKPGAGVGKDLPESGDICITGTVNVSGFMEMFVLQNTRLSFVMEIAEEITALCHNVMKGNRKPKFRARSNKWYYKIPGAPYAIGPVAATNERQVRKEIRDNLGVSRVPRGTEVWKT